MDHNRIYKHKEKNTYLAFENKAITTAQMIIESLIGYLFFVLSTTQLVLHYERRS